MAKVMGIEKLRSAEKTRGGVDGKFNRRVRGLGSLEWH